MKTSKKRYWVILILIIILAVVLIGVLCYAAKSGIIGSRMGFGPVVATDGEPSSLLGFRFWV